MKPNYKTSEFWFTVVSFIFSGLYLTGIIKDYDNKEELIETFAHAVESIFLVGTQVLVLSKYIKARNKEKTNFQKININTADEEELTFIPGVGIELAHKIVEHRESNGLFSSIDELDSVDGIGPRTMQIAADRIKT